MDKLAQYRQALKQILAEHAQSSSTTDTVNAQLIFDEERDHYQLNYVGSQGHKRIFGPIMHFDIQDEKIWIQYNGTEDAVAKRLVEMGIPPKDIVVGFHSAYKRQYAVG